MTCILVGLSRNLLVHGPSPWSCTGRVACMTIYTAVYTCRTYIHGRVHGPTRAVYIHGRVQALFTNTACTRPCIRPFTGRLNTTCTRVPCTRSVHGSVHGPYTAVDTACVDYTAVYMTVWTAVYWPCTRPCTSRVHDRL